MKARTMRYVAVRRIEICEIDVPAPGHGQVLVEKKACGLCASDVHAFAHGPESLPFRATGHEGVGIVRELGPGVTNLKVGDNVLAGGFESYGVVGAAGLLKVPVEVSDYALWVAEPVACVVNGLDTAAVHAGERVALVGAGFMGLLLLQGLVRCPWSELVVMDVDKSRLEVAKGFGAPRLIDLKAAKGQKDAAAMEGRFDVVIDCSGAQAGLDLSTKLVRTGGNIVLFGWIHGPAQFDGTAWHLKGIHIVNASPMSSADMGSCWRRALAGMASGLFDLKPLVTHRGSLDELPALLAAGSDKTGGYIKGVVCYG